MSYAGLTVACCLLGVPRLKCSRVGLSAASPRPEDRPAGFPLLSLTRSAVLITGPVVLPVSAMQVEMEEEDQEVHSAPPFAIHRHRTGHSALAFRH